MGTNGSLPIGMIVCKQAPLSPPVRTYSMGAGSQHYQCKIRVGVELCRGVCHKYKEHAANENTPAPAVYIAPLMILMLL